MATVYQAFSLSNWTYTMYNVQRGWAGLAWVYFTSLVLLLSYFAVNLVLAVISDNLCASADEVGYGAEEDSNFEADVLGE